MTTERIPAEAFHPGEYLQDEIDARGWTQAELAEILGRPLAAINEIVTGKRGITPETAHGLSAAFGSTAEYWMRLETNYQLWHSRNRDVGKHASVQRKARLYEKAPIKSMIKRHWIERSDNIDVLEGAVIDFFGMSDIHEDIPNVAFAARTSSIGVTPSHMAWIHRAAQLAKTVHVTAPFTSESVANVKAQLRVLLTEPQEIRHVPKILAALGIRLVILEHLPQTKIDGAAFWLDGEPVIVMSLRFDRIDNFWFVLMHELDHIDHRDNVEGEEVTLGNESEDGGTKSEVEIRANAAAAAYLIDPVALDSFILRKQPLFSPRDIQAFAAVQRVHPGIVVGQLNNRFGNYAISPKFKVRVREIITATALTDGWGQVVML